MFKIVRKYLINLFAAKKTILFDLFFSQSGYHGGGEYAKSVFRVMVNRVSATNSAKIFVAIDLKRPIDPVCKELIDKYSSFITIIDIKSFDDIRDLINSNNFHTVFLPAIVIYSKNYRYLEHPGTSLGFKTNSKVVGVLHDIRELELIDCGCEIGNFATDRELYKEMFGAVIRDDCVERIITVSQFCKNNMVRKLNLVKQEEDKITVLYPIAKIRYKPKELFHQDIVFQKTKYLLALNLGREEKNGRTIIAALDDLFSSNEYFKDFYVVLIGLNSLDELKFELKNKTRFIPLNNVKPENLEFIYKNAKLLVYASLHEGFGYPPLEVMKYAVPSVVSRNSALVEVYNENCVVYCDPLSIDSIKSSIENSLKNPIDKNVLLQYYNGLLDRQNNDADTLVDIIVND